MVVLDGLTVDNMAVTVRWIDDENIKDQFDLEKLHITMTTDVELYHQKIEVRLQMMKLAFLTNSYNIACSLETIHHHN